MREPDSEGLLDDILTEGITADFRATLLDEMLRQAVHYRRRRAAKRVALTVTVALGLAAGLWVAVFNHDHSQPVIVQRQPSPEPVYRLVRTQQLDPHFIVGTQRGTMPIISSARGMVATVETSHDRHLYRPINDDQLLALLAGRGAALIRQGPDDVELLLPDHAGERGLPAP